MRLWEYLKEKMLRYADRTAFAGTGLTYAELLRFDEIGGGRGALTVCGENTREATAREILKSIAKGDTVVPVAKEYGEKWCANVREAVRANEQVCGETAFVMFTSGTTGVPKGVMLTDENIIFNLEYISSYFDLSGLSRICVARPLAHISALTGELLYALCCGMTIYFYEETFMPQRFLRFLREKRIEVFCATPTLYLSLVKYAAKDFPVKVSALSGERLTETTAKKISESFPKTKFYNVYGLTEHSPRVSALLPDEFVKKAGSIGKPIGNANVKIEDGELLVKSPCVMKGYYRDGIRTREKIKEGWLYTGDMTHTDGEGYYYIDGRKDDMIIRAGINIFPEEIEEEVKKCPNVEDCIVYGRTGEDGVTEICLNYIGECEPAALRRYLAGNLNAHFMPNVIDRTDKLQRTASGKKVRK